MRHRSHHLLALLAAVLFAAQTPLLAQTAGEPSPPPAPSAPQSPQPQPGAPSPAPPAAAPGLSEAANGMLGAWEFSNADRDKVCHFTFRTDVANGGYRLDIDRSCPNLFPSTRDIVAWNVDNYGGLRLLNGRGDAVVELTEVESGMFDGFTPEEGRYVLQTAAAVPTRTADDIAGNWAVTRGGRPICQLTLASGPPVSNGLPLQVKPGCDASVTRFGPVAWKIDQGELVLLSPRGLSWQFEESDANSWAKVPETADPILLVRQ